MSIGVLMLDTQFERLPGDIGHPASWPFELVYEVVDGATPEAVVTADEPNLLEPFLRGANALIKQGVSGITTTCGFLGIYQQALAKQCSVPVATSALLQYSMIRHHLSDEQSVGILTYRQSAISDNLLTQTGCDLNAPVVGFAEDSNFYRWIMTGDNTIPRAKLETDVRHAVRKLTSRHQSLGAILCECTNLPPFIDSIRAETTLPVYDMTTLLHWFYAGLKSSPRHTPQ